MRGLELAPRVAASLRLPRGPVFVVAIGKAAPAMAEGALARCRPERCVVVCPDETDARGLDVLRAAHPVPDARSVRAAQACLELAREASLARARRGVLVVLVSGGASSLVCAPAGVDLATKRAVTKAMLRSGASVVDLNVVRKHLSRIKGGMLARAAGEARVVTRIASDVVGGSPADVGSGPSVADPSTVADARRLLRRWAPSFADLPLVRTNASARGDVRVIASPEDLAKAVARALRQRGVASRVLPASVASVEELAREYLAARLRAGTAIVRAAEPSLVVTRKGRGGRSTHLAALVGRDLPRGVAFLALATDGVDGASGTGGALVRAGFADRDAVDRALARFDTGPLHRAAHTAIPEAASGHNLADLHVLFRA
jgi:hydroxypyruvate reductase